MNKIRWPIGLMVLAVLALALPLVASADNQWGRYAWPTDGGPVLTLGANLSLDWPAMLTIANDDWNSEWIDNTVVGGRTNPTDCQPATGEVEICNSDYDNTGWLGIAGIWIAKGKQITRGYVKVNDFYFEDPESLFGGFYDTDPWRQMVMCQEVGHIFGLDHQDENFGNANLNTCMDYTNNPESNQHPNDHDYEQLLAIYGSDGGDGGGGGKGNNGKGNGGNNGKPSTPPGADISQWGKAISTDGKGRPDLFELDLGKGNKVFTHVLWAD